MIDLDLGGQPLGLPDIGDLVHRVYRDEETAITAGLITMNARTKEAWTGLWALAAPDEPAPSRQTWRELELGIEVDSAVPDGEIHVTDGDLLVGRLHSFTLG